MIPDAEESIKFWKGIWSVEKFHNRDAEWLKDLKNRSLCVTQQDVLISEANVRQKCKRMPNWKTPGFDGAQGFWLKRMTSCHQRIATQLNEMLNGEKDLPEWLTLCKRSVKGCCC